MNAPSRADADALSPCDVDADGDGSTVTVVLDGERHELSRTAAAALRADVEGALVERREFVRTAGEHRPDGSYVVERRGADSAGHRKVFDSFGALERLYRTLPREFTAQHVGRSGLTGGRRHMVVWHLAEHPAFACSRTSKQPLAAAKEASPAEGPERQEVGSHGD